jgi:ORF6N domain
MICLNQLDQIMTSHRKIAQLESAIYLIRGQRAMFDSDLATIYGVITKRLNEQVRRNTSRFPEDFAFHLTAGELTNLRSQFATSSFHAGRRYRPRGFTEHGAIRVGRARSPSGPPQTARRSVPTKRREMGFYVREKTARYRVQRRTKINDRNSKIS